MGKEERRAVVLEFLARHELALPPAVIYRNLRFHHNITFSSKTIDSYLQHFVDQGKVRRVDPGALSKRELVDVDDSRGYYLITDEGKQSIR